MLNAGLVKGYRGLLYPTSLCCLANRRADSGLHFNYALKVELIY